MAAKTTTDTPLSDTLADEATAALDTADLTGAPTIRSYLSLRPRLRRPIVALLDEMEGFEDRTLAEQYDLIADLDEALEKMSVDPVAYAAWAVGEDAENRILALFNAWAEDSQLGEASSSSN